MILDTMDFTDFFNHVEEIFSEHFDAEGVSQIMDYVYILADANFRCYKANMIVIDTRKNNPDDHVTASEMEWVARNVGEYRVASKAMINKVISKLVTIVPVHEPDTWVTDDIVYSIGEMMDRLSIETIKREDFAKNNREEIATLNSQKLSDRVEKYLKDKLEEINDKGFYECVDEQRTYNLDGIEKDLAL
jgi:hypothetical protein